MKKSLQIFALLFCIIISAQAPEKFSYQAVVRNASNALVTAAPVGMKISILKNSAAGAVVYSETQTVNTNANGLVSVQIGAGTVVTGTIAGINWGAGSYYIKTETDPAGGTNYSIGGTSQLLSVPYAMYSKTSGSGASFTLPYAGTSSTDNVVPFKIINSSSTLNQAGYFQNTNPENSAPALSGINSAVEKQSVGVLGAAYSAANGILSSGVNGYLLGVESGGAGVYGVALNGIGVYGTSNNGSAIRGYSGGIGTAGFFVSDNPNGLALSTYGKVKIRNNNEGAGKVLTSDATGNATWQEGITPFVHFSSIDGSEQQISSGVFTTINSWTGLEEAGGANYNPATGEYTILTTGYYRIAAKVNFNLPNTLNGDPAVLIVVIGNATLQESWTNNALINTFYSDPVIHLERFLSAGMKIKVMVVQYGRPANNLYSKGSTFSVDLLRK